MYPLQWSKLYENLNLILSYTAVLNTGFKTTFTYLLKLFKFHVKPAERFWCSDVRNYIFEIIWDLYINTQRHVEPTTFKETLLNV